MASVPSLDSNANPINTVEKRETKKRGRTVTDLVQHKLSLVGTNRASDVLFLPKGQQIRFPLKNRILRPRDTVK